MNKKEKYINFIVDDLVKNTEINYEEETVTFPFHPNPVLFDLSIYNFLAQYSSPIFFTNYLISLYGVNRDEKETVYNRYKERILFLINNG